jgi:hypothetical protein
VADSFIDEANLLVEVFQFIVHVVPLLDWCLYGKDRGGFRP